MCGATLLSNANLSLFLLRWTVQSHQYQSARSRPGQVSGGGGDVFDVVI